MHVLLNVIHNKHNITKTDKTLHPNPEHPIAPSAQS